MGRYWVPEYGSAEDEKQFEYLLRYWPYNHVQEGMKSRSILFTAAGPGWGVQTVDASEEEEQRGGGDDEEGGSRVVGKKEGGDGQGGVGEEGDDGVPDPVFEDGFVML